MIGDLSLKAIYDIIDQAMVSRDRYVSIYFTADEISVTVRPIVENKEET